MSAYEKTKTTNSSLLLLMTSLRSFQGSEVYLSISKKLINLYFFGFLFHAILSLLWKGTVETGLSLCSCVHFCDQDGSMVRKKPQSAAKRGQEREKGDGLCV